MATDNCNALHGQQCHSVLVVDDNVRLADATKAFLTRPGVTVHVAYGSEEAKGLLSQHKFAVCVIDIALKTEGQDVEGLELIDTIRELQDPMPMVIGLTRWRNLATSEGELASVAFMARGMFSFVYADKSVAEYMRQLQDDVQIAIGLYERMHGKPGGPEADRGD